MATTSTRGGLQVEYAVSGKACCKACGCKIAQNSVRIGKETRSDHHDGWEMGWYHLKCCNKYGDSPSIKQVSDVKHWDRLRWEDQLTMKKFTGETQTNTPAELARKKHIEVLWQMKDILTENLNNKQIKALMKENSEEMPDKIQQATINHVVADGMLWGRLGACPTCNSYKLFFDGTKYKCKGWLSSGFTRCDFEGDASSGVPRTKWAIPAAMQKIAYLKNYKYPADHATAAWGTNTTTATTSIKSEPAVDDSLPEDEVPVAQELYGMRIITAGTKKDLGMTAEQLATLIEEHGGEVVSTAQEATLMIATEPEMNKKAKTKKVKEALGKIPILSIDFINNLVERKEEGITLRDNSVAAKYIIEPSTMEGTEPIVGTKYRKGAENASQEPDESATTTTTTASEGGEKRKRAQRRYPKDGSDVVKIDAASPHIGTAKIIVTEDAEYGATAYNVMLNQTDISTGQNKFYRLQAYSYGPGPNSNAGFINYGRIGTGIGDKREYPSKSHKGAIEFFIEKFEEKTGNLWANRDQFVKKGGKYYMVDLDDGWGDEDESVQENIKRKRTEKEALAKTVTETPATATEIVPAAPKKRLHGSVADLIRLLFDKEMMKKQLVALDIDIKKMPLGKISKKQILEGYSVLTKIQDLLQENNTPSKASLADCANKLYTLIPHDFGTHAPPLISTLEEVKKKMNMLDTLIDIEIATNLMKEAEVEEDTSDHDKLEANYKVLKTGLEPLDRNSELFKLLESYAYNTQDKKVYAPQFTVEDIFCVTRGSEESRFEPWADNHNRMLLWHGSRLTNWVGILSQGLRIAPPEAPKTGYRFGKGVYFADCVSKSTSYCFSTKEAPTAVLLLGEVALGDMNQLKHDQYMEKAPAGTHCTKALGEAAPDPKFDRAITTEHTIAALDQDPKTIIKVPSGKIAPTGLKTSCTHNEYIVYDVAQIKIKYLLRVRINHGGR